jgi:translation initiation factor 4A
MQQSMHCMPYTSWGRKGVAINFITRQDIGTMKFIESYYKSNITELPSDYTTV